jgi:hypothetical protein
MPEQDKTHDAPREGVLQSFPLPPGRLRETNVQMVPEAPTPPRTCRPGPRHMAPPVPEGPEVPDSSPSPPVTTESPES